MTGNLRPIAVAMKTSMHDERIAWFSDVDFSQFPFGGILSLLKDYLKFLPAELADLTVLIGLTRTEEELGQHKVRLVGTKKFQFIPVAYIPDRFTGSIRFSYNLGIIRHYFTIRALDPSILYAHTNEIGLLLKLLFPRRRVIVHFHGLENPIATCKFPLLRRSPLVGLYKLLCMDLLIRIADKIIINIDSERYAVFVSSHGEAAHKFHRLPPVIDSTIFHPRDKTAMRRKLGLGDNAKILIFHGRLELTKGVDLVIDAFNLVIEHMANAKLIILGDGSHKGAFEQKTRELNLGDQVLFLGNVPRETIGEYLSCADIFVTGTHFEAISVALLEAIASGLPVVSTLVGGVRDAIENGYNGFYIERRDPREMAEKILLCLGHDQQTMSNNALEVAKRFHPERIIPDIVKVLLS